MLLLGKERLQELGAEFERFYGKMTPERVKLATEAEENWKRLSGAGQGLAMTIGSAITPTMMSMIVPLREWIANNRELVATKVDHAIREIGDTLKNVDWSGIGGAVRAVWDAFKGLGELLGAKGSAFLAAGVIFGPIAWSAIEAAKELGSLTFMLAKTTLDILALNSVAEGGSLIGFLADLANGFRLALGPMEAFNLAMVSNPVGAIVLGLTVLAAIAYEIYKNWAPIAKFFSDLWDAIKAAWAPVGQWFSDLWTGILEELQIVWKQIKPVIDAIERFWNQPHGKTSAEKEHDARNSPARRAAAAANRASFSAGLGQTAAYLGNVALQLPGISNAAALAHSIQSVHDFGKQDRMDRERVERTFIGTDAIARAPALHVAGGKVDSRAPEHHAAGG